MNYLMVLSITTGGLCLIWAGLGPEVGLLVWAGFAGCTSFFAAGGKVEGLKKTVAANISGVILATISIYLTGLINVGYIGSIITGIATFIMCAQARFKVLSFIPGAFVGSYCTFAANGEWVVVLISILIGTVLGYCCEKSAIIICERKNIEIKLDN